MEDRPSLQSAGGGIVERAKAIIMQPKLEWAKVAGETAEPMKVLLGYALPLILIGPIAALIGGQLFGYNAVIATFKPTLGFSLTVAVTTFVQAVILLFVIAFAASQLSPKFGGKQDFPAAFRLVAYSMTAAWLAGIFGLIPALGILALLGLYSFYLFYLGATPVLGVPEDKAIAYTVLTVVVVIVVYLILATIVSTILGGMMVASGMVPV
jgi:hypothetical protein